MTGKEIFPYTLALIFICLCKVCFALWFRLPFQILTLLTAFAKNSNITKSEQKWKINLRIKLGWKCSSMWSHETSPDVPWWWQLFSAHITAFPDIKAASLYIGATQEPVICVHYKISLKSKTHAEAKPWKMHSASFQTQRVLSSASITVNMHYFCSWAQDLLLSQADQGFLAHQSTAIWSSSPLTDHTATQLPNYHVPVMHKAS